MLSSYLLQATEHWGLQAQNCDGEWVDCPPIKGTLVVALGQGMEAITQGICTLLDSLLPGRWIRRYI